MSLSFCSRYFALSLSLISCFCSLSFVLCANRIAVAGGTINGVFNSWSGSFDQILQNVSGRWTQSMCGWLGFASTVAFIVGGLVVGPVADTAPWNRRMHGLMLTLATLTAGLMALFTIAMCVCGDPDVCVPTPPFPLQEQPLVPKKPKKTKKQHQQQRLKRLVGRLHR